NRCASGLVCLIRIELKTTRFSYSPSTMRQRKPINCPAPFLVGPMLASSISAAYLPGGTSEKGCVPCSVSTSKASSSTVDRSDMGAPMFPQGGEVEVDRNGNLLWRAEPILGGEGGPSFEKEKAARCRRGGGSFLKPAGVSNDAQVFGQKTDDVA